MITTTLGSSSRPLAEADPNWINQHINGRRNDDASVCVQVRIQEPGADVALATPDCGSGHSGGRPPNPVEQAIIDLWRKHRLTEPDFTGGMLAITGALSGYLGGLAPDVLEPADYPWHRSFFHSATAAGGVGAASVAWGGAAMTQLLESAAELRARRLSLPPNHPDVTTASRWVTSHTLSLTPERSTASRC